MMHRFSLGDKFNGFSLRINEGSLVVQLKDDKMLRVDGNKESVELIESRGADIDAALEAAKVGQRMKDGTACIMIKQNQPVFVSEQVIVGEYRWDNRKKAAEKLNDEAAHGHKDWRVSESNELERLCLGYVWQQVAPKALVENPQPLWGPGHLVSVNPTLAETYTPYEDKGSAHRGESLGVVAVRYGSVRHRLT